MFKSRQARTFVRTGNEKRPKQVQRVATPMWGARGAGNSSFLAHRGNSLDSELLCVQALRKLLGEDYTVKRLTVALLVCSAFPPTVFAQCIEVVSVEQTEHRSRIFSDWLEMVKGAEMGAVILLIRTPHAETIEGAFSRSEAYNRTKEAELEKEAVQ